MIRSGDFHDWITARCNVVGESEGNELVITCPWCGNDKMYANPERRVYVCFRCRESGRAEYLVAKVEDVTVREARERMRERTIPDEDDLLRALGSLSRSERDVDPPANHMLPEEFIPCFTGRGWKVPRYLDDRNITDSMIVRHGLGFAKEGRYRDRIIIPIVQGGHRTFLTRLMGSSHDFRWKDRDTGKWVLPPKYMTPRDAGLSRVLYGATWVQPGVDIIMVEGSFDVMRLTDLGFPTSGVLGKRLSHAQAKLISELDPSSVTFLYDDGAHSESHLDADTLSHRIDTDACPVYVACCPDGYDPDTLGRDKGRAGILDVLAGRELAGSGWSGIEAGLAGL